MSDQSPLFRVESLSKTFPDGTVRALRDVSFAVRSGEYVAVTGPSGSGKSTLLNMLGGLDRPDSGEVYFEGQALSALPSLDRFRAQRIGFVFQSFLLLPTLSAEENVQVPMFEGPPRSASERRRRAQQLLEEMGLTPRLRHLPSRLSVGERQRVAVARALANDPTVLLADEPTGNLDSATAEEILDLFDRLRRERGLTLIVVTHSDTLSRRASRLLKFKDGRVEGDQLNSAR